MRTCGDCTFCCKVMAVVEINKPAGSWCPECEPGKGCKTYSTRPAACEGFECFWLQSGKFADGELYTMPDEMRPDRIKVAFGGDQKGRLCFAYVDPATPLQWQTNRHADNFIEKMRRRFSVVVVCGESRRTLLPADGQRGEEDAQRLVQIGGQWKINRQMP